MKLNKSALGVVLLSSSLLLMLNSVVAQKSGSPKPQRPKAQTPSPTPAPQPHSLAGSYTLNDPAAATKTVNEAIEATVKDVGWLFRGLARDKLKEKNLPLPQKIILSYTANEVTVTTDTSGTIETPVDGTVVTRTILGEKLKVSTKWRDGNLERTFKGAGGERVNTYSLSDNGNTLNMQVTVTSPRLRRALTYRLVYSQIGLKA